MPRLISVAFVATLCFALNAVAQEPTKEPDAVSKRLIQAKKEFRKACDMADRDLLLAIDEKVQEATSDGDLERAKKWTAIREACEKEYLLPTQDGIYDATIEYGRQFQEAKTVLSNTFDELIAELTKSGDMARAGAVQAETKRWLDVVKSRKTPKTRYQPPVKGAVRWAKTGHYYKVLDTGRTPVGISFAVAKKQCEELGGYLACGETADEIDFLKSLADRAWTGAHKDKQGKWVWITGVALANAPVGDGKDFGFARTVPQGLQAIPQDGTRQVRTWAFICEWEE